MKKPLFLIRLSRSLKKWALKSAEAEEEIQRKRIIALQADIVQLDAEIAVMEQKGSVRMHQLKLARRYPIDLRRARRAGR